MVLLVSDQRPDPAVRPDVDVRADLEEMADRSERSDPDDSSDSDDSSDTEDSLVSEEDSDTAGADWFCSGSGSVWILVALILITLERDKHITHTTMLLNICVFHILTAVLGFFCHELLSPEAPIGPKVSKSTLEHLLGSKFIYSVQEPYPVMFS